MPKDEWGVKRVCPNCSTRFYDLRRNPMTCPNCGSVHTAESLAAGKMRSTVSDRADPKTAVEEVDADAIEDAEDDVVLEDEEDVDLADDDVLDDETDDDSVSLDDLTDVAGEDDDEA